MIVIRHAETYEVLAIKSLLSRTWLDTYSDLLPENTIRTATDTWHAVDVLEREIEHPDFVFLVATSQNEEHVGLCTARNRNGELHISRLYVDPKAQRQGIGELLLQHLISLSPEAHVVYLEVERDNMKGLGFYRKQGFIEKSQRDIPIGDTTISVIEMELPLPR